MVSRSTSAIELPEWYTLEKKAEKTIEKLNTVKELDYYLRHPEAGMRRLAILRLSRLKLKESINNLKEILDEPQETQANRELAAWSIKAVALKYDLDLFISHRLLTRYTGNETLMDLYSVKIDTAMPSPSFSFSAVPGEFRLKLQNTNIRIARDTAPDMEFDSGNWLTSVLKSLGSNTRQNASKLLTGTAALLKKSVKAIAALSKRLAEKKIKTVDYQKAAPIKKKPSKKQATIGLNEAPGISAPTVNQGPSGQMAAPSESNTLFDLRNTMYGGKVHKIRKQSRNLLLDLLYVLLFPVRAFLNLFRYLLKHKLAILAASAAVYCFLAFTSYGRVTTLKYLGVDFKSLQSSAAENIKQAAGYAVAEFKNITGMGTADGKTPAAETAVMQTPPAEAKRIFTVTAKKGLNIRTSPSSTSAKAGSMLEYGTEVTYLDKSQSGSESRPWYYVMSPDGTKGWVYSGWLKEKESVEQ
jgi:hypothetical protein